jgi:rubrerythrin
MEVLLSTKDASAIDKEKEAFALRSKLAQKTTECSKLSLELQGRDRLMQTLEASMARVQQDIDLLTGRASEQDEALDRY